MKVDFSSVAQAIKGSPSGISAVFIPINEKWAIKLFSSEEKRDDVKETQRIFAEKGFGPDVGDNIDLPEMIDEYQFGYFTEIIKTCVPGINRLHHTADEYDERQEAWYNFTAKYGSEDSVGSEVHNSLERAFKATGITLSDMHAGNLGWKNDKIIPIDFGCD